MSAKQAGSAHLSSVAGKCLNTRPIYPAWFEEHITEAQKTKFKEYAAAKVEANKARQLLASSSRDLMKAHAQFDDADDECNLASEKLAAKWRIAKNIDKRMRRLVPKPVPGQRRPYFQPGPWYEEHLTEAQKNKFKEYAAAKVEAKKAQALRASSSRDLVKAQAQFDYAEAQCKLASEDLTEKLRITYCIRTQIQRLDTKKVLKLAKSRSMITWRRCRE